MTHPPLPFSVHWPHRHALHFVTPVIVIRIIARCAWYWDDQLSTLACVRACVRPCVRASVRACDECRYCTPADRIGRNYSPTTQGLTMRQMKTVLSGASGPAAPASGSTASGLTKRPTVAGTWGVGHPPPSPHLPTSPPPHHPPPHPPPPHTALMCHVFHVCHVRHVRVQLAAAD